jgi:hypothetical protein
MTFKPVILRHGSIEAEALRCERDAVISEFKELTTALMVMTGWSEGVAMFVMERLILAYEIGVELRESRVCSRLVGKKLTVPPAALGKPWREVYALTRDPRAVALVEQVFLVGWERNKRSSDGAPKKTAGATVMELMKRTDQTENDKRERWRMGKRLKKMIQEFRSRRRC